MKNIVILTSIESPALKNLVDTFNSGERFKVTLLATDRENCSSLAEAQELGLETLTIPREEWRDTPARVIETLKEKDIDILVLDRFLPLLDEKFTKAFPGKIIDIEECAPEEAPRKVTKFLTDTHSVDRQWADVLGLEYDAESVEQAARALTPPAMPQDVAAPQAPFEPHRPEPFRQPEGQQFQQPVQQPQPYQQPYGQPYQQPVATQPQNFRNDGQVEPMPPTYLLWSILATILCCFIPGIVAIIFSSMVSSKYYARDYEGARRASRMAEYWIIASIVLGVVAAPFYFLMFM